MSDDQFQLEPLRSILSQLRGRLVLWEPLMFRSSSAVRSTVLPNPSLLTSSEDEAPLLGSSRNMYSSQLLLAAPLSIRDLIAASNGKPLGAGADRPMDSMSWSLW
uniref:Uncharacterized protein n=1 Tax=Arundo donax TaxID=35708 RepID=A0A0A9HIT4_ARUDO